MKAYERLLKYVTFPTSSDERANTCPSTEKQKVFGAALVEEMKELGITVPEMAQLDSAMQQRIRDMAARLDVHDGAAVLGFGARVPSQAVD